jgi:hypothetical protein
MPPPLDNAQLNVIAIRARSVALAANRSPEEADQLADAIVAELAGRD